MDLNSKAPRGWRCAEMAKLVFGMMQSLDGYVDHLEMGPPGPRANAAYLL